MEQILELETTDDITSIRSRIDFALPALTQLSVQSTGVPQRARLLLVVPRKNKALHSLVNMKLLARTVSSRAVELAIVTPQPLVRDYAREAGVKVFGSVRAARRAGWVTTQTPVATPAETLPPVAAAPPAADIPAASPPVQRPRKRVQKKKFVVVEGASRGGIFQYILQQLGTLLLIVALALAVVIAVIVLLPEAAVTLTPVAQPVETRLIVKADPAGKSVDFETLTFPARLQQVELRLSGEIDTVKTELAPTGRSAGRVVFINRTENEQLIPISTTLSTSAGAPVEFTTVETATIPAGVGSTSPSIPVLAVEPGPRGNLLTGQLNRIVDANYALVARVLNEQPFSGGSLAPARVVEQDDKPRLDAHLRQVVQQEGLRQLQESLAEQEFIPPESVQVIVLDVKYREFSGDFSDTFGGEMQAVVRATVIGGYNANRLALAALQAQVPPGHKLDLEGLQFGAGEVLGIEEQIVSFRIFASGQAVPVIDPVKVAKDIAWLPIGDAQKLLSEQYRLLTVPGVELKPDWVVDLLGRLPFSSLRIDVVINNAVSPAAAEGG